MAIITSTPPTTSQRTAISVEVAQALRESNLLVEESHRVRPRYFDGKFLSARDLTRDQAYFLARQAAYARALGTGVVEGLEVAVGSVPTEIVVNPGFGYTSAGELVSLAGIARVSLAQLFSLQTLAAQLGTLGKKQPPLHNRTGVFVLGMRALEFSANPVAAYPTTLDGDRTVEPGDIVEASALTLTYYGDAPPDRIDSLRGDLARDAFVTQSAPALPAEILPLALLALSGDNIRWVDMHLARRRAGQSHADVLGFGFAPRLLREAHLAQYVAHLNDIMARPLGARPAASQYFSTLPAAGPMPGAAVSSADFSQSWFPPGVVADLSLVPEDEVPSLVEASLTLEPIDLSLAPDALASTAVSILVAVPREQLALKAAQLQQRIDRATTPAATGIASKRLPIDAIRLLQNTRLAQISIPIVNPADTADTAWAALLSGRAQLWYTRRRHIALRPQIDGTSVPVVSAIDGIDNLVTTRFTALGIGARLTTLLGNATSTARADMVKLLASEKFNTPVLAQAALTKLEAAPKLDAMAVAQVAVQMNKPGFGDGIARLTTARPDLIANKAFVQKLAASPDLAALDTTLAQSTSFGAAQLAAQIQAPVGREKLNLTPMIRRRPV
jgi:hypothetical protein